MLRRAALCLTAFLLGALAESQEPQWPMSRKDAEGGASLRLGCASPLAEWHYMHRGGRRYKPGMAVWASPALAIVEGRPLAFIGGYDQTMHALDLQSKEPLWRKLTNGELQNAPAVGRVKGVDIVFWGSADRTLYAAAAINGRLLWTRELVPPSNTLGDVEVSSPCLLGGRLYVACFAYDKALARGSQRGTLHCLEQGTGELLWSELVCDGPLGSPVGFGLGGRSFVALAARRGLLQCYDVSGSSPAKAWSFQMPHEVLGSPVAAECGGRTLLFLGSKYGNMAAIDASTGAQLWSRMAGNWFDNSACVGEVGGRKIVYAGSHDYCVYALDALSGEILWKRPLGGEAHSAPCFFKNGGREMLAEAALDNHLYMLDARTGELLKSWFTGNPIWDKLVKGETLWGSPAAFESDCGATLVYGSFNDYVYAIPAEGECSLTATARSAKELWLGMAAVGILFLGAIVPLCLLLPRREGGRGHA